MEDLERDTESSGFRRLRKEVSKRIGVDYQNYSKKHLRRRFHARMRVTGTDRFMDYYNYIKSNEEEIENLRELLTVNVTKFKRDTEVWDIIEGEVLPEILDRGSGNMFNRVKAWSAGCATGEEPYSLAISYLKSRPSDDSSFQITATDLDSKALEFARNGEYPEKTLKNLTRSEKKRYFHDFEDGFAVKDELKDLVEFKEKDIFKTSFTTKFDMILCRNLMIYFNNDAKIDLMERLVASLDKGGFLIIGMSENLRAPAKDKVEPHNLRKRVFVKK